MNYLRDNMIFIIKYADYSLVSLRRALQNFRLLKTRDKMSQSSYCLKKDEALHNSHSDWIFIISQNAINKKFFTHDNNHNEMSFFFITIVILWHFGLRLHEDKFSDKKKIVKSIQVSSLEMFILSSKFWPERSCDFWSWPSQLHLWCDNVITYCTYTKIRANFCLFFNLITFSISCISIIDWK